MRVMHAENARGFTLRQQIASLPFPESFLRGHEGNVGKVGYFVNRLFLKIVPRWETALMVTTAVFKRAHEVLKENVRALMAARHVRQVDLALWCGHGKSWVNKWLNGEREIQFRDLDRLADFFGLLPHQLFTPGISPLTERRLGTDRRKGHDRRTSTASKLGLEAKRPELVVKRQGV